MKSAYLWYSAGIEKIIFRIISIGLSVFLGTDVCQIVFKFLRTTDFLKSTFKYRIKIAFYISTSDIFLVGVYNYGTLLYIVTTDYQNSELTNAQVFCKAIKLTITAKTPISNKFLKRNKKAPLTRTLKPETEAKEDAIEALDKASSPR